MKEVWIAHKICTRDIKELEEVKLRLVQPLMDKLRCMVETFFFCTHMDPKECEHHHLHLRIRPKLDSEQECRDKVSDFISKLNIECILEMTPEDYSGEEVEYGAVGWKIAQKHIQYSSLVALHILSGLRDKEIPEGSEFTDGKFVHMLMNQLGCDHIKESKFCIRYAEFYLRLIDNVEIADELRRILESLS